MKAILRSTPCRSLLFMGLMFGLIIGASLSVEAQGPPSLELNPVSAAIQPGEQVDVVIELNGASNVYGLQFDLIFNPAVLSVVDADPGIPGVQISLGSCPAPDFVVLNGVDTIQGVVEYAVTQLSPTTVCDGGLIASVNFECLAPGRSSAIVVSGPLVSDPDGNPITHNVQNGLIHCVGPVYLPLIQNGGG